MKDRELKRARIMVAARLLQEEFEDDLIRVDTVIVEKDRVLLAQGNVGKYLSLCGEDYREIDEIIIDDKTVEAFWKECGTAETGCSRIAQKQQRRIS